MVGLRHVGASRQANNLGTLSNEYYSNTLDLAHDWRKLLTALAQIPDNLRTHSFACKNLSLPAPYFRLFQRSITS